MKIEQVKISELKPATYNPRKLTDKQKVDITLSLQKFGFVDPIIVNKDNTIIGGHQRLKCWEAMGNDTAPVFYVDLSKEDEKELNIRLNKNSGEWDWDLLASEFDVGDLKDWGFEDVDFDGKIEILEPEAVDDNFEIPDEIKTDIVLGDLFEIGEHRLLCGDSTKIDDVEKLMNGEKADLAHNDPPYGLKKEKDGVLNDNLNYADLLELNRQWINNEFINIKENGSWYCWGSDEPLMDIYSQILKPYISEQKATFRNLITWDKGRGNGQNSEKNRSYAIADEKCLFVMMGVQGFNNNADNYFEGWEPIRDYLLQERLKAGWDVPTMKRIAGHSDLSRDHWTCKSQFNMPTKEVYLSFQKWAKDNNKEVFKKEYDELKKEYYNTRAYFNNTHDNFNNVWKFERTSNKEREGTGGHATPKPLALCGRAINSSCRENGLVLDLFLGSGSTMVASHQLKRKCYGIELDPKYCQVIVDRMRKLDPALTIKKNGENVS